MTGLTIAAAGLAAGVVLGLTTQVAAVELDTSRPEVDALLRALGFGPYGLVMIWVALGVRRTAAAILDRVDALVGALRDYVSATRDLAAAARERTAAEREDRDGPASSHRAARRPKTNPVVLEGRHGRGGPGDPRP